MRFIPTPLAGAYIIEIEARSDERGFFGRSFCAREFADHGLHTSYPQMNVSHNARARTLRGMHYQAAPHGEVKVVRCTAGALFDVIVDLRAGSPTRFRWFGVELTPAALNQLYIPAGFGHGFLTLADRTEVAYLMGTSYVPEGARGFRFDDPLVGIRWPAAPEVISERDRTYPDLDPAVADA